jgi:two-component system response regulator HydG
MSALMNYSWPGNVRELKSAFECACVTCQGMTIPAQPPSTDDILKEKKEGYSQPDDQQLNRDEIKKI